MNSTRISRMVAVSAWLKLGYLVGCDAGIAFCLMFPIGLRTPFRMMAEAHEAAHRRRTQSESVVDQIGYVVFQAITYIAVVPASFLGRFLIGPFLGVLTMLPFCVPAFLGAIRQDAPQVDHFNWFFAQANQYGPISVWGATGTSLFLTVLIGLGYLPNISLTLPGVASTWSTLGLAWTVPLCCSFMAMSLMGVKQWLLFTKQALTHQNAAQFPLTGTIKALKLSDRQKGILLDLFEDEHQKKVGQQILYQPVTTESYDPSLLLAQLQFAEEQQQQPDNVFNKNIQNRKLKAKK